MYHPIYEKLSMLCKKRGTSITSLCAKITGSTGNLVTWKKGKIYADDLDKIRNELNISIDELFDNSIKNLNISVVEKENNTAVSTKLTKLLKEQRFVDTAKIYSELSDEYRERIYGMVIGLAMGLGLNIEKILGDK